jgi:hypothetical protein
LGAPKLVEYLLLSQIPETSYINLFPEEVSTVHLTFMNNSQDTQPRISTSTKNIQYFIDEILRTRAALSFAQVHIAPLIKKGRNSKQYAKKNVPKEYITKKLYFQSSYFELLHYFIKCAICG